MSNLHIPDEAALRLIREQQHQAMAQQPNKEQQWRMMAVQILGQMVSSGHTPWSSVDNFINQAERISRFLDRG